MVRVTFRQNRLALAHRSCRADGGLDVWVSGASHKRSSWSTSGLIASCLAVGLASCNFIVNTLLAQWYLEFFTHNNTENCGKCRLHKKGKEKKREKKRKRKEKKKKITETRKEKKKKIKGKKRKEKRNKRKEKGKIKTAEQYFRLRGKKDYK